MPSGNLERFPDPVSCLYKAICLPPVSSRGPARLRRSWENTTMGDISFSLNIKPTSCPRLPALLSSIQKDKKTGSLVLCGCASSCGGVGGQCWELRDQAPHLSPPHAQQPPLLISLPSAGMVCAKGWSRRDGSVSSSQPVGPALSIS